MRAVALVGILVALSFAGCLEAEPLVETGSEQAQFDSIEVSTEMPERRFEPNVILDTPELEVEQGSNPEFHFYITDMKDYPFPVTFIDWALFHDRNPNPVAEGDATDLPGTFNQTLFAPGYHMFGFRVDDTQVLNETRILILSVGEHEDELPTEYQMAHFRWRMDSFFNKAGLEPLPPAGEAAAGDVCAGAPVQEPVHISSTTTAVGTPALSITRQDFSFALEPCQFVVDIVLHSQYSDHKLYLVDGSGAEVANSDSDFVMGETLRYESATPLEPGNWAVRVRGYASGPDMIEIDITFE